MKEKIVKLDAHVTEIPKEELKKKLGGLKKSELMRSIILNERDFGTCTYDRTLRSLWYVIPMGKQVERIKNDK